MINNILRDVYMDFPSSEEILTQDLCQAILFILSILIATTVAIVLIRYYQKRRKEASGQQEICSIANKESTVSLWLSIALLIISALLFCVAIFVANTTIHTTDNILWIEYSSIALFLCCSIGLSLSCDSRKIIKNGKNLAGKIVSIIGIVPGTLYITLYLAHLIVRYIIRIGS